MPHNPQNMQTAPVTDGTQKALPKAVVEAIQTYRNHVEADIGDERTEASRSTVLALSALEAEITRHCVDLIAAELHRLRAVLFLDGPRVRDYVVVRVAELRAGGAA